ncbi:hypothetical protein LJY25_11655 [Hymenobacter sp. BT175]|uniref:hypothetical protein n=1 Tax=Hymenobacter translucens TaxID=2886507 RepID=UPI001D0DC56B|nr:hypothetical protein [Hymenobacter translucens]MCC2547105.1 hypothetical protein [Hymenobacter translucens]
MSTLPPDPSGHLTQIVRYRIELPAMTAADQLVAVREILMSHNLLVDRLEAGEAIVTSATSSDPDWPAIKKALQQAGFPAAHPTTVEE